MGAKIAQWIGKAGAYIKSMPKSHAAMRYITWYAVLIILCCTIYVGAWVYDWYTQPRADLVELRAFLHEIASAAWIAVIGFLAKSFIDRDNNGIPDQYEEEKEDQKCKE
ncbi:hypothetical protein [Selenomonas artemidis]|uniref:hypothetical protein n=1 Tax=Selenomonas artemidis TaxID=671224 RepID=UPI0023F2066F|nr:hypothetical protein [Selenomonas artemidis]